VTTKCISDPIISAVGSQEEPIITINGRTLTNAQAMTVRAAIEHFASYLQPKSVLGDDTHAVLMRSGYLARIAELRTLMVRK
jgi:hypothetical protein